MFHDLDDNAHLEVSMMIVLGVAREIPDGLPSPSHILISETREIHGAPLLTAASQHGRHRDKYTARISANRMVLVLPPHDL